MSASSPKRKQPSGASKKAPPRSRSVKPTTERERRSAAAVRGWTTRRVEAARRNRRTFQATRADDDEDATDFAYTLYDAAHPLTGESDVIALWQKRLRPYYGQRVRLTLNGFRVDPASGKRVRIFIRRVGQLDGYGDMFGPGSLYAKAAKTVRNRGSQDELVVTSLTVELADDGDEDAESE